MRTEHKDTKLLIYTGAANVDRHDKWEPCRMDEPRAWHVGQERNESQHPPSLLTRSEKRVPDGSDDKSSEAGAGGASTVER